MAILECVLLLIFALPLDEAVLQRDYVGTWFLSMSDGSSLFTGDLANLACTSQNGFNAYVHTPIGPQHAAKQLGTTKIQQGMTMTTVDANGE